MMENIQLSWVLPSRLVRLETHSVKVHSLIIKVKIHNYLDDLIILNYIVLQALQILQVI